MTCHAVWLAKTMIFFQTSKIYTPFIPGLMLFDCSHSSGLYRSASNHDSSKALGTLRNTVRDHIKILIFPSWETILTSLRAT